MLTVFVYFLPPTQLTVLPAIYLYRGKPSPKVGFSLLWGSVLFLKGFQLGVKGFLVGGGERVLGVMVIKYHYQHNSFLVFTCIFKDIYIFNDLYIFPSNMQKIASSSSSAVH